MGAVIARAALDRVASFAGAMLASIFLAVFLGAWGHLLWDAVVWGWRLLP